MTSPAELPNKTSRQRLASSIALTIIAIGFAAQLARICQVESSTGEVPFLSANDRSRWCTIATLSVNGSYEIDDILQVRDPETRRRVWYTIDLVKHRGSDGKQHFYSSKPPLLPTLYSGVYRVIRMTTGASLMKEPFFPARMLLVVVNLLPLVGFWWLIAHWAAQYRMSLWAYTAFLGFVVWGCLLTTFANSLNNHLPAAIAIGLSLYSITRITENRSQSALWYVLCGLCTSFAASNELPALSWVAAAGAILLICNPLKALLCYVPATLPVAIAFFTANYAAHGELSPAYAHRDVGELISTADMPDDFELSIQSIEAIRPPVEEAGVELSETAELRKARREGVYELWDPASEQRIALKTPTAGQLEIYEWGDWYDYPSSYWTSDNKTGVDKGEPNRAKYIAHCLIGHHGILSLTPFWLLSIAGCFVIVARRTSLNFFKDRQLLVMLAVAATTVVCIGFYLARPLEDCNYGGISSGFRWGLWLTPLWMWLAFFGIQHTRSRVGKTFVNITLILSVFSASFPWANPWTSPWPMQLLTWLNLETWH
ncbi:MAG: hypothetical protein Aurels2KO_23040 [Aureliella sp.]